MERSSQWYEEQIELLLRRFSPPPEALEAIRDFSPKEKFEALVLARKGAIKLDQNKPRGSPN